MLNKKSEALLLQRLVEAIPSLDGEGRRSHCERVAGGAGMSRSKLYNLLNASQPERIALYEAISLARMAPSTVRENFLRQLSTILV